MIAAGLAREISGVGTRGMILGFQEGTQKKETQAAENSHTSQSVVSFGAALPLVAASVVL